MKSLSHFLKRKMIIPFFFFWSLTTLSILFISFLFFLKVEDQKKNLILLSTNESLKSPISLGSFLEIRSRLYSINKEYEDYCIDFISNDFTTSNCQLFTHKSLVELSNIKNLVGGVEYSIVMYHSRMPYFIYIIKFFALIIATAIVVGIWFFNRVNLIAKKITDESSRVFQESSSMFKFQILEFDFLKKQYEEFLLMQNKVIKAEARSTLARQVSHDIRSPLSALDMILDDLDTMPFEKKNLLKSAINRIQDISNDLLGKSKSEQSEKISIVMLSSVVEMILSEKRIEFRKNLNLNLNLDLIKSYGLFSQVKAYELKTIISNLINNSYESCSEGKDLSIDIKLYNDFDYNIIEISDNGAGISENILNILGHQAITSKEAGNGIGLLNAKKIINSYGGELIIKSNLNIGTSVFIKLKRSAPPSWFVEKIKVDENLIIVCIDDDLSVLELWKQKIRNSKNLQIYTSFSHVPFEKNNTLYLIDYEILNSDKNGIDFILEFGLEDKSILVTSRFEEEIVKTRVDSLNLLMIPKNIIRQVPIEYSSQDEVSIITDILIDNDELVRMTWELSARKNNKHFLALSCYQDFEKVKASLVLDINVYIDEELDNNIKGREIASLLNKQGFKNIYITSGHSKEFFDDLLFLKGVLSKSPPFR